MSRRVGGVEESVDIWRIAIVIIVLLISSGSGSSSSRSGRIVLFSY